MCVSLTEVPSPFWLALMLQSSTAVRNRTWPVWPYTNPAHRQTVLSSNILEFHLCSQAERPTIPYTLHHLHARWMVRASQKTDFYRCCRYHKLIISCLNVPMLYCLPGTVSFARLGHQIHSHLSNHLSPLRTILLTVYACPHMRKSICFGYVSILCSLLCNGLDASLWANSTNNML